MGSGVHIVKWLLCGFHRQPTLFIYEQMAPLVAAMEHCIVLLLVIVGEERRWLGQNTHVWLGTQTYTSHMDAVVECWHLNIHMFYCPSCLFVKTMIHRRTLFWKENTTANCAHTHTRFFLICQCQAAVGETRGESSRKSCGVCVHARAQTHMCNENTFFHFWLLFPIKWERGGGRKVGDERN